MGVGIPSENVKSSKMYEMGNKESEIEKRKAESEKREEKEKISTCSGSASESRLPCPLPWLCLSQRPLEPGGGKESPARTTFSTRVGIGPYDSSRLRLRKRWACPAPEVAQSTRATTRLTEVVERETGAGAPLELAAGGVAAGVILRRPSNTFSLLVCTCSGVGLF